MVWWGNLRERNHVKDLDLDGYYNGHSRIGMVGIWTELIRLRTGKGGGRL
jgi:hypothetical protein